MSAEPEEAREFAKAYRQFLAWLHQDEMHGGTDEVVALVRDHLAGEALARSVVRRELPSFEHFNLQVALDAWTAEDGRRVEVLGLLCRRTMVPSASSS